VVVQELIPGDDADVWMYNGYFDRSSRCLASFTGRKIRQVPPGLGLCTAGVCVDNPELSAAAEAFLGAVGYRGVVDIDFRRGLRSWLGSLRGLRELATFSPSDPLPFLVAMRVLAQDTLGGRWQAMRQRRRAARRTSPGTRSAGAES